MAGLTLGSGIKRMVQTGRCVQARGAAQVTHRRHGRNDEAATDRRPRG